MNVDYDGSSGYFAAPAGKGRHSGIVMIHEWWGLNDNIRRMADTLAKEGYYVLAVDLYDGKVAQNPDEAMKLVRSIDQQKATQAMVAAVDYLKNAGAIKVGSLGWCFGGGQSLQLALSGEKLDATVIYYGSLVTDEKELSRIRWPLLGIFGAADKSIPVEKVNEFKSTLDRLRIKNEIYIYPGVGHAFANPTGKNYAPKETADAWSKTLSFLKKTIEVES